MDMLEAAIKSHCEKDVRRLLDSYPHVLQDCPQSLLMHDFVLSLVGCDLSKLPARRQIVYMLRNAGLSLGLQNQDGDTALHLAALQLKDPEVCEALLQCGADLFIINNLGGNCSELVSSQDISEPLKELIKKYSPGLWKAVKNDDLMSVRKLINLWCTVDLVKGEKSLKELALDKGTEHIIRLIIDIEPSMRLAHCVMAGDTKAVQKVLHGNIKPKLDFRNFGDMGATPLFYAIMQNNTELVQLLRQEGARMNTIITLEEEDIPVCFAALNKETDPELIKSLMPSSKENVSIPLLHYRGRDILQHCVETDVSPGAVRYILQQGYPELVAARNQKNQCARQLAESTGKVAYVKVIDEVVHNWYLDHSRHRQHLALMGYQYLGQAEKDGVPVSEVVYSMETSSDAAKFDTHLNTYQEHIGRLHQAAEAGDLEAVRSLITFTCSLPRHFHCCLAASRKKGDGMPLIHRAVLNGHIKVTDLIARTLVDKLDIKLDDVRDPWYRTALHYSYALGNKALTAVLLNKGASDFTMDKDGRSPLVFREHKHVPAMTALLQYHAARNYKDSEPNPWDGGRKMQFAQCPQHQHSPILHRHNNPGPTNKNNEGNKAHRDNGENGSGSPRGYWCTVM